MAPLRTPHGFTIPRPASATDQDDAKREASDFRRGSNAYWQGLTDDISESPAWHRGYAGAQDRDNRNR